MKNLLLILLVFCCNAFGQTGVGIKTEKGEYVPVSTEMIQRFKTDTLLVICPEYIDQRDLKNVIHNTWKLGPSKIVNHADLDKKFADNRLVLGIEPYVDSRPTNMGVDAYYSSIYLELYSINGDTLTLNFNKLKIKNPKISDIAIHNQALKNSKKIIAYTGLQDQGQALSDILNSKTKKVKAKLMAKGIMDATQDELAIDDIAQTVYKQPYFFNLNLGFYKNYIQFFDQILYSSRYYSQNIPTISLPLELKALAQKTLYIPDYITYEMDQETEQYVPNIDWLEQKLKKYDYNYQIVATSEIDNMIMEGREIYYLRYNSNPSRQYSEVINASDGSIIYSNIEPRPMLGNKLKTAHFKVLNKIVKKYE